MIEDQIMDPTSRSRAQQWVHTRAAMPQLAESTDLSEFPFTLRQTVRVTLEAASHIRLRLSNAFGLEPLTIAEVTISRSAGNLSGTNALEEGTIRHVTFCGDREARIAAGAHIVSVPIDFRLLPPATAVTISLLFGRLQKSPIVPPLSIVNQAAGANSVLVDGSGGPSVLARLDRDLLSLSGVRYALIFEGINGIGISLTDPESQAILQKQLIAGYMQVATRLSAAGIFVIIATLTPFMTSEEGEHIKVLSPYPHPAREETRQHVNEWIRNHGATFFGAVVDFDAVLRNP